MDGRSTTVAVQAPSRSDLQFLHGPYSGTYRRCELSSTGASKLTCYAFPYPTDESKPCSRHLMRDWWYKAEELAELEHIDGLGWHGLRRKFADELRGVPLKDLADLGGWTTPRTILEVY